MEPIRVLIADDHPLIRNGLRTLLDANAGTEVVGDDDVGTGREAIEQATRLQPDVVVMDLHMPDGNGVDATREIVNTSPHIAVLVLTIAEDDETIFAAMRAGARGYLLKGAGPAELVRAVEMVSAGVAVFGPTIAQRVIDYFAVARPAGPSAIFPQLTEREREILELMAQGVNNTTIGQQLFITSKTVRNYVSNIFSKLQVADRAEAIVRARRAGFGQD
ncbi:response regulator transcription factor [Lentzea alba]|uniref:response regulator n=1 Tax=Lentzea alba TaxID=2714351 RepID=UPI0039BF6770